jgi:threonine synthase
VYLVVLLLAGVRGVFDDCLDIVKAVNNDHVRVQNEPHARP